MSECTKMASCLAILLSVVPLTLSMPYEIVYTGDGCECPKSLGYKINVPKIEKPKEYAPNDYGYKIDVPVQAKAKVTYSFDFTVEEPRTPKPPKPAKLNLFAKIDRITMNRGDCVEAPTKYPPAPAPPALEPSYPCSCGKCGISKPTYRYVYKKVQPCKCQRPRCNCNSKLYSVVNSIPMQDLEFMNSEASRNINNNIRQKREVNAVTNPDKSREKRGLERFFFPNLNQRLVDERPGRFVKLYNKKLNSKRQSPHFDDNDFDDTITKQRSGPFDFLQRLRPRIVKRDIKGEYDLIQKEGEEMDLTLPEIIQYMPETLQPDFKRGPCKFGCSCQKMQDTPDESEINTTTEQANADFETTEHQDINTEEDNVTEQPLEYQKEPSPPNSLDSSSHAKRNAADYNQEIPFLEAAPAFSLTYMRQLPQYIEQRAYRARQRSSLQPKSTNPNFYKPQLPQQSYRASPSRPRLPPPPAQKSQYVYDRLGHKYLEKDGRLRLIVPDPTGSDNTPLKYAGDLDIPATSPPPTFGTTPSISLPPLQSSYPVRTISSADLDKKISEIVYSHPDFIDATSHYGGALVDPEPHQEQETKDFLRKLIDGRLELWFGNEDDRKAYQATYFTNPPQKAFGYETTYFRI